MGSQEFNYELFFFIIRCPFNVLVKAEATNLLSALSKTTEIVPKMWNLIEYYGVLSGQGREIEGIYSFYIDIIFD